MEFRLLRKRRCLVRVPQLYQKLSAIENLRYFAGLFAGRNEQPEALLERVGLAGEGSRRVSQFSKGMKVRLGFVRALLNRRKLLFLDEPTAGLDPVNVLRWVLLLPFVLGAVLYWGLPTLTQWLLRAHDFDLAPYHVLVVSCLVVAMVPLILGQVLGFMRSTAATTGRCALCSSHQCRSRAISCIGSVFRCWVPA